MNDSTNVSHSQIDTLHSGRTFAKRLLKRPLQRFIAFAKALPHGIAY